MRRLLTFAVGAAAAAALAVPASAGHDESPVPCYGVRADTRWAGICAGVWCTDLCLIVVEPHCEGERTGNCVKG